MATIERFEDIEAWQVGRDLRRMIYGFTKSSPFSADFALVNQIRRAAQSVTSNIAEGFERDGNKEFTQFLSQSKGSAGEVKDQLYCAIDEGYISRLQFEEAYRLADRTGRLIGGLMSYLRGTEIRGHKFDRNPKPETRNSKP